MTDANSWMAGITIGSIISFFLLYMRVKKHVKEEIVDPDIAAIRKEMETMKTELVSKVETLESDRAKLSEKLDNKFAELNVKMDQNTRDLSRMQGMLTALFNGIQGNNNNYGQ